MLVILWLVFIILFFVFAFLYTTERDKNNNLAEENGRISSNLTLLREKLKAAANTPLTAESIETDLRSLGYEVSRDGNSMAFRLADETWYMDATRLPYIVIRSGYDLDRNDYDWELLYRAAVLTAEQIIIVKVPVSVNEKAVRIVFDIEAMDNDASFRENLPKYIRILFEARRTLSDVYNRMLADRQQPSAPQSQGKTVS